MLWYQKNAFDTNILMIQKICKYFYVFLAIFLFVAIFVLKRWNAYKLYISALIKRTILQVL